MNKHQANTRTRERGFTLIETVLATAIGAIIGGVLVVVLFQFNSITRQAQTSLTLNQNLQSAATVLNRDVIGAKAISIQGNPTILTLSTPTYTWGDSSEVITSTVVYAHSPENATLTRNGSVLARQVDQFQVVQDGDQLFVTVGTSNGSASDPVMRSTSLAFSLRPNRSE